MNRTDILALLGAPDAEMEAVEAAFRAAGIPVAYATIGGRRVTAGEAYQADRIERPFVNADVTDIYLVETDIRQQITTAGETLAEAWRHIRWHVIDHHHEGDPGYGRPPEEFLPASSIGQVIAELARLDALPEEWDIVESMSPRERRELGHDLGWDGPPEVGTIEHRLGHHYASRTWASGRQHVLIPHELVMAAAADHCLGAAYRGECPGVDPDELMRWRAESREEVKNG